MSVRSYHRLWTPDARVAIVLLLITFVSRALFIYRDGMSDPDTVVMAAGMVLSLDPGTSMADAMIYGRHVSPGAYFFARAVYPLLFNSPEHMIAFLNWSAVLAMTILAPLLFYVFRWYMPRPAAAGGVVLALFSPVVWESSISFHPLIIACPMLFGAMVAWRRIGMSMAGILWFALVVTLSAAAFIVRTEMLFLAAPLGLSALFSDRKVRNTALMLSLLTIVFVMYGVILRSVDVVAIEKPSLPGYVATLSQMYRQNFSTSGLTRTIPWAAMAIGLGTIGAAAIGLFIPPGLSSAGETSQFRSQRQLLLVAVAWILPGLIFWLPQPLPILRHYMLIAIAVAWMVAWKLLSRLSRRNSTIVVASLLVVNLLIPDVAYRIYNRKHPEDPKSPNGTFFYYRGESKRNISRFQDLADRVVRVGLPTRDNNSFAYLSWEAYAYVLYAMAGSHHKMTTIGRSTFATVYQLYEYQLGEAQFRFVVSPWLSVLYAKDQLAEYARASAGSNYRVFLPAEATSEEMSDKSFDFPIVRY